MIPRQLAARRVIIDSEGKVPNILGCAAGLGFPAC